MLKKVFLLSAIVLFFPSIDGSFAGKWDKFGGVSAIKGAKTGFFHVESIDGRKWFVDPEGNGFLSIGVTGVKYARFRKTDPSYFRIIKKKYGTEKEFAVSAIERLRKWGFNTLGGWSDIYRIYDRIDQSSKLPYTIVLHLGYRAMKNQEKIIGFPDVFSKNYKNSINLLAEKVCHKHRDSPFLLGYFTDNELGFLLPNKVQPMGGKSLLERFLLLEPDSAGRNRLVQFFRAKYKTFRRFKKVWRSSCSSFDEMARSRHVYLEALRPAEAERDKERFLTLVADEYHRSTYEAIRRQDSNHLIMGSRFASNKFNYAVASSAARYNDVLSANIYSSIPPKHAPFRILKEVCRKYDKSLLISEFSFRLNSKSVILKGAKINTVQSEEERIHKYRRYLQSIFSYPFVVGCHWFRWVDRERGVPGARFEGGVGLVKVDDEPWWQFIQSVSDFNKNIYEMVLHEYDE